jgi:hypothetical protein
MCDSGNLIGDFGHCALCGDTGLVTKAEGDSYRATQKVAGSPLVSETDVQLAATILLDELRRNPNAAPREIYDRLLARGVQLTSGGRPLFETGGHRMKKPTIGSTVHLTHGPSITYAAIVTGHIDDQWRGPPVPGSAPFVSLCVFLNAPTGKGRALTSHRELVGFSEKPAPGCWSWPPEAE